MSSVNETKNKPFGEYVRNLGLCDAVIFGEGEISLRELLNDNWQYPGINNTHFRQVTDLDSLPLPDYSGFNWKDYTDPRILITGSRGCVRHCTFCDIDLTWPKFTFRSAHHLVEEIRKATYEYGLTKFEFTDSLINGSIKNFNQFNELLIQAKAKNPAMASVTYTG
jgi:radical SAM superfamily enzyme YgiQ (UPF0313 family)